MGVKEYIKKAILASAMNKEKASNPFNIEYSDRYQIPSGAGGFHNNSQYFSLHDPKGRQTLFLRLALRGGGAAEVWMVYREGDGPPYMCPKDHFPEGAPSVSVECIQPGKELHFVYRGVLKKGKLTDKGYIPDPDAEEIPAEFDGRFYGISEPFEFSRHMSTEPVARALAAEKFTREFRSALAANHQVHFEQAGKVNGILRLGGRDIELKEFPCMRDHSYGKRDWAYMDRHIWMACLLENGDFINTSLVRYPAVRNLQTGFYIRGKKTVCLKSSTLMDEIPGKGIIPPSFGYAVEYEDGQTCTVECKLDFSVPYYFGDGKYVLHEGVSNFTVNGIPGRGITEFGFNADPARW
jgi:hypothetical protein